MLHDPLARNSTVVRSKFQTRLTRAALQTAFAFSDDLGAGLVERLFTSPRRHRRPDRERAVLATARPLSIEVALSSPRWRGERRRIAAWRWGYGPAVLLVHGWEGRGTQLGAFVEPLVRAGFSVLTFDAFGHGDSPGRRLYLADQADCVAAAARAAGPLHAIIAHSFGAAAVLLAHRRGGIDARRSVMIAPNVLIEDAIERFARQLALDEPERKELQRRLARQSGVPVEALRIEQLVGARDGALLVIHDRTDPEVPFEHGERLAAIWRQARLHATVGLGHRRVLRDERVVAQVVDFIQHGVAVPASDLVREVDRLLGDRRLWENL
jgi:pimeloyl-ACP methyl ester carboxylesterase